MVVYGLGNESVRWIERWKLVPMKGNIAAEILERIYRTSDKVKITANNNIIKIINSVCEECVYRY